MARVKKTDSGFEFTCPGCNTTHLVGFSWSFNGDLDRPTFSPSVLVRSGHFVPNSKSAETGQCWCTYNKEQGEKGEPEAPFCCYLCHSFIRDGQIQFLLDCTHSLAGKTVELSVIE